MSRGSHINTNNGKVRIPQTSEEVNPIDGKKSKDDTIYDYLTDMKKTITEANRVTKDSKNSLRTPNTSVKKSLSQSTEEIKPLDGKKSVDDTIYDYLTDEYGSDVSKVDFDDIVNRNPGMAVQMFYQNAVAIAQKGLYNNENVKRR